MYMDYKEIEFEIERRDNLIDSLKEENKKLKNALQDVVNKFYLSLLYDHTGLSEERCKEITDLAWHNAAADFYQKDIE